MFGLFFFAACTHAHRKGATEAEQAIGDLVLVAFYFLLQVGEDTTKARRKLKTRTRQFRLKDVTFYKRGSDGLMQALPPTATDADILSADAAMLKISNQKNGHAGQCVHTWANTRSPKDCPIRALGRRAIHIRQHMDRFVLLK